MIPTHPLRGLAAPLALCLLLGMLLFPKQARACASCGCGDPTLTAMGLEKPFRHRIRLALEERLGVHETQEGETSERTLMNRTALSASYWPTAWLGAAAMLPLLYVHTTGPRTEPRSTYGIGDLELMLRAIIARDRKFSPRHLFGVLAGVKTPTGPRRSDAGGYPAPDDEQPGSGSWDGLLGMSYSYFGSAVAVFLSASYKLTSAGYRGYQRGGVLGMTALAQVPIGQRFAIASGIEGSFTQRSLLPGGSPAPDSGGFLISLSYGGLIALGQDWLLRFAVQTPVIQAFYGSQHESPTLILSLIVDL